MRIFLSAIVAIAFLAFTEPTNFFKRTPAAMHWVDSVFNTLTPEQKIGQLMIIRAHSNLGQKHVNEVTDLINKYNVGGLCFFQGGPVRQAKLTNYYQGIAKTPLMIAIDGEWGLGMRLDSVINFPRQLMMGAVPDAGLVYEFGKAVGEQCKRIGIHVNYAPDIDINNNPNNPVINDRSFGEDKYKVALFGTEYMRGMQDVGVMACAKHFPGHGDVAVDSHFDLPVINKSMKELDSLELYPFKQLFKAGVGSVMVAHLYIPSIDDTKNQATSLSKKNVTDLLRNEMGYGGITFTDALEMQGVAKFYPAGEASVQSLIAGNDMLCLPGDVPGSIEKVLAAIKSGKLSQQSIDERVKKVLLAKYHLGLNHVQPVEVNSITADINAQTLKIKKLLSQNALTLLRNADPNAFGSDKKERVAYLGVGADYVKPNAFANRLKNDYNADLYFWSYKRDMGSVPMMIYTLQNKYDRVIIGMHNYSRRPANNFGLSYASSQIINQFQNAMPTTTVVFGNPYAIKNISEAKNLIAAYEDDDLTQQSAADLLEGKLQPKGELPVTVDANLHYGDGIKRNKYFPDAAPEAQGLNPAKLKEIDGIVEDAIKNGATPGGVVLVAKNGKVVYNKAYGYTTYEKKEPVTTESVYDLASVTKISATTVSVMKLYEEGKIDLNKTLGDYLTWTRGTDKADLTLRDVLLHQAGLVAYIPFYRATIDTVTGKPNPAYYRSEPVEGFSVRVAEDLYLRNDYVDTIYSRILKSKLGPKGKYVYSDNDFIFLGKIVEAVSGMPLNEYVKKTFYEPLLMNTTRFKPKEHLPLNEIVPTEREKMFRMQLLRGDVHDPGAAMFGGVAGHAGLFSNAYDLAQLYQMLLNGGEMNGVRYLKKETIDYFNTYHSDISRRGLGFDKPEKDNATRKEAYPTLSASPQTFGHTGYTGTCVWADPKENLLFIFLSNRVHPDGGDINTKLLRMNVRSNIHETIYQSLKK